MKHHICAIILALAALLPQGLFADELRGDTTVSLVTMYAGNEIYELEGHTAIRISMPEGDWAVSYGTFDFNQPNFVYRFVKGETDYWVSLWPWAPFEASYREAGRRIVEQRIDMTGEQKQRLLNIVAENLLPDNRTYRYNYVKDNCATRPLRVIERALGDSIILGSVPERYEGLQTWREVMTFCHKNYPWYQFGIDLALGPGIDRVIDNRELAFAPVILCGQLDTATSGGKPVVASTTVLNDVDEMNAVLSPTPWYLTPMFVMSVVLICVLAACAVSLRRGRPMRRVYGIFYGVFGLVGCLLTFLIFISVHEATSPNLLYMVFNPLCFIGVWAACSKKASRIVRYWFMLNIALTVVLATIYIVSALSLNVAYWPLLIADLVLSATYLYITCPKKS